MMRTWFAATTLLLTSACLMTRVGPGVLRQDWNQRPRDPDPMANPATQYPDERWSDERHERIPGPGETPAGDGEGEAAREGDSTGVDLGKRTLATMFAVGIGGWVPVLEATGTFEEDPATRRRHRERAQRAQRREADRREQRVERAPARP